VTGTLRKILTIPGIEMSRGEKGGVFPAECFQGPGAGAERLES